MFDFWKISMFIFKSTLTLCGVLVEPEIRTLQSPRFLLPLILCNRPLMISLVTDNLGLFCKWAEHFWLDSTCLQSTRPHTTVKMFGLKLMVLGVALPLLPCVLAKALWWKLCDSPQLLHEDWTEHSSLPSVLSQPFEKSR